MSRGCGFLGSGEKIEKAGDHHVVTTRKVILRIGVKIREAVGEHEVKDIISFCGVYDILRPSSYVGFVNKVEELRRGVLGGQADLRSI